MNLCPTNISQRQQNCVLNLHDCGGNNSKLINNIKKTESSDIKNDNIIKASFDSIPAAARVSPQSPHSRGGRFTRKQLLSRSRNRKEKLLQSNVGGGGGGATAAAVTSSPHHCSSSWDPLHSTSPCVVKVCCEKTPPSRPSGEARGDDTPHLPAPHPFNNAPSIHLQATSPSSQEEEEEDQKSDITKNDSKSVHFSTDLEGEDISRGIQVKPPQFRLRFVPHLNCNCSIKGVCLLLFRIFLSQLGLATFLLIWTLLGAAAFHWTEGVREAMLGRDLRSLEGRLVMALASELSHVSPQDRTRSWRVIDKSVRSQEQALSEALASGYSATGGTIWNYAGSLLFAITMLTTIGFGAPVPRTPLGRTSAVVYSAVGVPLHLFLVVNFGALVADHLQRWVMRCRCRRRSPAKNDPSAPSPSDAVTPSPSAPAWLTWLPVVAIATYYMFGMVLFGGAPLFPLDFTTAGGVGRRSSTLRTIYAVYLEFAVIIAAISVNVWRNTASSGFITLGLRFDLLARGEDFT